VWAALGTVQSLAPKLARSLGISPFEAGALVCAGLSAQGAVFLSLGGSRAWAYRPLWLLASTPVCALGVGLILVADGFPLAAAGALLVGSAQAITYASSVFYALDYDHRRGLRTGIHEANLALAGALPMLGGWLADRLDWLRAPLVVVLVPCLLVALASALLLPRASAARDS
jgi:predicted MFS family arabinose efflux permease